MILALPSPPRQARKETSATGHEPIAEPEEPNDRRRGADASHRGAARQAVMEEANNPIRPVKDASVRIDKLHPVFTIRPANLGIPRAKTLIRNIGDAVFRATTPARNPAAAKPAIAIKYQHWTPIAHRQARPVVTARDAE